MNPYFLKVLLLVALLGVCTSGSAFAEPSGKLVIFHAGSLAVPFADMEKAFEAKYPKVDVQRESGGSTKLARMITELGKPADIMASADYLVIDKMLVPEFAQWNARFATNQIVLCYTPTSRYADEINDKNWFEILQRPDVVWGHSDPNLDPCGYRSLMTIQLAEKFTGLPGLYDKVLANRPEKNVRPKSVELISMMESGNMDYAFEYMSVAVQHGLEYVTFDDHINLGNYAMDPFYKSAVVKVTGKEPGTFMELTGSSITYGVTMLKAAANPEAAEAFLAYLLDEKGGLAILKAQGQPPIVPASVGTDAMHEALPQGLKALVKVAK
ncbi:molybdate/tungstate transport system substrate-binding protein [Desulfomicrobium norvegicum]|uniref:Molybdate/tungstate transport system substrate-binding protein n=1 Tax=Desulfomicrobium norvegicum (strain DSM 1741 / NCIMB 8310) TaxID=52561 RepID=A0A8G2C092_DESNO|nr:tungstate ABC transporter substrate-binding protein WtpA [Desulfomicrobium norvegicum]SFL32004.1 molybdate/tungstate transport system substrate-binding protein [Desulfomicrobium norvegicum]